MEDENQHWIPKFLIKNFVDKDGRVFCLDIRTDEVTKPPPKHAASEINYNNFNINGESVTFEDRLGKIEHRAAPIIKRIITARSLSDLTYADRLVISDFMAAQTFRTQAFYEGLGLEKSREEFGLIFAELWRSAFLATTELLQRKWALMSIDHEDEFYLGDHPLVLQYTEPTERKQIGLDVTGAEALEHESIRPAHNLS